MQASKEIRQKLVQLIMNLVLKCMDEARSIPYVLDQDEMIELLMKNPAKFHNLVVEEDPNKVPEEEESTGMLTATLDAFTQIGQFESLNALDLSLYGRIQSDKDLSPALDQIDRLARTFAIYIGNIVTLFEKEFEEFTEKLRSSLQQSGLNLRSIEFTEEDMAQLEAKAESFLNSGQYFQAFVFERLLSYEIITRQLVSLQSNYNLGEKLIRRLLKKDKNLFSTLVKFVLKACYISHASWEDLFFMVVRIVDEEPEAFGRSALIDLIEQDAMFCCNLLHKSFSDLKKQTPLDRRLAIDKNLDDCSQRTTKSLNSF
jgi:hypothetical protein